MPLAEEIKKVVSVPVVVAGKLGDPAVAAQVIEDGKADLIAVGRGLLADAEWPRKAAEGRLEDICPCIYCNEGCAGSISNFWRVACVVNPALGREKSYRIEPARRKRRVLVVGGGPGGMEAARIAALRGHDVTLYEKGESLGGQLIAASVPQFKKPIRDLLRYLEGQVRKARVKVELEREATPASVKSSAPDVLLLATGAVHNIPDIPGACMENVATATEVLLGEKRVGERVVVVGGGQVGAEAAWYLAEQGKKVAIVEMQFGVALDVNLFSRFYLLDRLDRLGVETLAMTTAKEVTAAGVVTVDMAGSERALKADTVVLATGFKCCDGLAGELRGEVPEVHTIGSCVRPGKIGEAIRDAARVAREL